MLQNWWQCRTVKELQSIFEMESSVWDLSYFGGKTKAMVLKEAKSAAFGLLLVPAFRSNLNLKRQLFSLRVQVVPKCKYHLPGLERIPSSSPFPLHFAHHQNNFLGVSEITSSAYFTPHNPEIKWYLWWNTTIVAYAGWPIWGAFGRRSSFIQVWRLCEQRESTKECRCQWALQSTQALSEVVCWIWRCTFETRCHSGRSC